MSTTTEGQGVGRGEWWMVERGRTEPKPVQVIRHSASSVWVAHEATWRRPNGEKRCNRTGEWTSYFPTEAEAVAYIRHDLLSKVERANADLHRHQTALGQVESYARRRGLNATTTPHPPSNEVPQP
jgi:hypothetical protein